MHHLHTSVEAKSSLFSSSRFSESTTSSLNTAHSFSELGGPAGKHKAAVRSLSWRSIYMFVSLLALLGATGSQSKIVEFICKQLGGSNKCPAMPTCPAGEALRHKPHSKPSYDGCGTHGVKVSLSPTDFSSCCNLHDLCYGQCGSPKKECDEYFEGCMIAQCHREHHIPSNSSIDSHHHNPKRQSKEFRRCVRAARLYYHGVYGFGCFAFRKAQKQHCECGPIGEGEEGEGIVRERLAGGRGGESLRGLYALMERAAQAMTPTAGAVHWKWEEFL